MCIRLCLALLLLSTSVFPQEVRRLADVQKIYVDSLGKSEGADLLRLKIQNRLVGARSVAVVTTPEDADAILKGAAQVTQGYHAGLQGSVSDGTGNVSGRADSTQEADVVLQLVSKDNRILWADESQRERRGGIAGLANIVGAAAEGARAGANGSSPTRRRTKDSGDAADSIVRSLLKAIDKDKKLRK